MTERTVDVNIAQWVVQAMARLAATYAALLGVLIVHGGKDRWANPAYETALSVPGAPASWGIALTIAGGMALVGSLLGKHTPVIVGLGFSSLWMLFFALSFVKAVFVDPLAPTTAPLTYGCISVAMLTLALAYRTSRATWRAAA